MRRTELRGFEWAGLRLAIEVPRDVDWTLPLEGFRQVDCHAAPDVHVSVEWRRDASPLPDGIPYCHEGSLFEASNRGSGHWVSVSDDGRLASFDSSFESVRVALPPVVPGEPALFPLERPLDDLVVIHRALATGALALRATAAVRDGRALVILGDATPEPPSRGTALWQGWLLIEPGADGIAVHPLPSTIRSAHFGSTCRQAWLEGLHVMDPMTREGTVDTLDSELAAGEILRYAFVPLVSPGGTDRLVEVATDLARRVPILRLRGVGSGSFTWRAAGSARSLVPPAGA